MYPDIERLLGSISFSSDRVKTDSRLIRDGDVFVAIKGASHDGHDHMGEVMRKGARAVLCEHMPEGASGESSEKFIVVNDTRIALGFVANRLFGDPTKKLKVHGITGTNGKTTTAFLIRRILDTARVRCGLISTVFTIIENDIHRRSAMTTPDVMELNRLMSDMSEKGKRAVALEISSHALAQGRIYGLRLDSALFCNITPEHLDYHKTMDAYLREKSRIFGFLKPGGAGVINADDPMLVGLAGTLDVPRLVTFGIKHEADVRAENIRLLPESTDFDVNAGDHGRFHVRARLPGLHNVYNMTAAAACLICGGIAVPDIKKGLENASSVPGRLEKIESRAPFKVFVDYAHTPDALENVLKCLRGFTKNRLICVFGCGGDRDKAKRPLMGRIAAGISDHVILTSDNPRQEDPEEILRQIEKGMPGGTDYSIIILREQAILKSLELAGEGDVVVIAGKGHEDRQILGGKVIPFDDREVAARILDKMGYGDADDPRDRER